MGHSRADVFRRHCMHQTVKVDTQSAYSGLSAAMTSLRQLDWWAPRETLEPPSKLRARQSNNSLQARLLQPSSTSNPSSLAIWEKISQAFSARAVCVLRQIACVLWPLSAYRSPRFTVSPQSTRSGEVICCAIFAYKMTIWGSPKDTIPFIPRALSGSTSPRCIRTVRDLYSLSTAQLKTVILC